MYLCNRLVVVQKKQSTMNEPVAKKFWTLVLFAAATDCSSERTNKKN